MTLQVTSRRAADAYICTSRSFACRQLFFLARADALRYTPFSRPCQVPPVVKYCTMPPPPTIERLMAIYRSQPRPRDNRVVSATPRPGMMMPALRDISPARAATYLLLLRLRARFFDITHDIRPAPAISRVLIFATSSPLDFRPRYATGP